MFLNSAVLWVVPGILVCRRIIQWFLLFLKGCAEMRYISEGWNWHIVIPIVTAFHSKEGKCFKIPVLIFLAYSLIFFPHFVFLFGLYSIICIYTSMLLHLPPVLLFGICFKQLNLMCLWWVIRFLTDVDRVRRKCRCTALAARLLQKVHLNAVCMCQVMWRGSTSEQEGAGLRVWVTRTCLGTIVIWEWF